MMKCNENLVNFKNRSFLLYDNLSFTDFNLKIKISTRLYPLGHNRFGPQTKNKIRVKFEMKKLKKLH